MFCEDLATIAKITGGQLRRGRPLTQVTGVFTDTRSPVPGGLFVALRGESFDGNQFARQALEESKAAAVLLDRPEVLERLPPEAGAIVAPDTRAGYLALAAAHRRQLASVLWLGVTGSVGKSSTKEMLAHILEAAAGWKVLKAKGSFNNAVGLSHTILSVTEEHRAAVLELGTNHPGEIRQLAAVARPQIAVITCAAAAHLEAFGDLHAVAREKAGILEFQSGPDVAVLNADDPHAELWRSLAPARVRTFGQARAAGLQARKVSLDASGNPHFTINYDGTQVFCRLAVAGGHQVANALAALSAALEAGVSLERAVEVLADFKGVARRFAVRPVRDFTLIDDAYNANPASFSAALRTLLSLAGARKFVVAGDMLELGPQGPEYHRALGRELAACKLNMLLTVGPLAGAAGRTAVECGLSAQQCVACARPEEAAAVLRPHLGAGDVVLVKGSHSLHLEKCCELLCMS